MGYSPWGLKWLDRTEQKTCTAIKTGKINSFTVYNYIKDSKYLEINLTKIKYIRPPTENYKI